MSAKTDDRCYVRDGDPFLNGCSCDPGSTGAACTCATSPVVERSHPLPITMFLISEADDTCLRKHLPNGARDDFDQVIAVRDGSTDCPRSFSPTTPSRSLYQSTATNDPTFLSGSLKNAFIAGTFHGSLTNATFVLGIDSTINGVSLSQELSYGPQTFNGTIVSNNFTILSAEIDGTLVGSLDGILQGQFGDEFTFCCLLDRQVYANLTCLNYASAIATTSPDTTVWFQSASVPCYGAKRIFVTPEWTCCYSNDPETSDSINLNASDDHQWWPEPTIDSLCGKFFPHGIHYNDSNPLCLGGIVSRAQFGADPVALLNGSEASCCHTDGHPLAVALSSYNDTTPALISTVWNNNTLDSSTNGITQIPLINARHDSFQNVGSILHLSWWSATILLDFSFTNYDHHLTYSIGNEHQLQFIFEILPGHQRNETRFYIYDSEGNATLIIAP